MKSLAVEDWLKSLALAPKTKAHIRSLMHTIFQCARRWELVEKNPIELVRVRGGSKRLRTPRVLTPEQFCLIPPLLPEPYRTQVWIAGCLGLRASEIMPLKWSDLNFDDCTLLVQRSMVHGRGADVKTEDSRDHVSGSPVRSLSFRPNDSLTIPRMALSIDFRGSVSFPPGYPSYRTLTLVLVGLTPTEYTSLRWTYAGSSSCLCSSGYTLSARPSDDRTRY
jgi:hypothetical protein